MDNNDKAQVFINFCSAGKELAEEIKERLALSGVTSFMADTAAVDAMDDGELERRISDAYAIVVVLDNGSQGNKRVVDEVREATDYVKMLFPIKLENFEFNDVLKKYLSNVQWSDCYGDKKKTNLDNTIEHITNVVLRHTNPSAVMEKIIDEAVNGYADSFNKRLKSFKESVKASFRKNVLLRWWNIMPLVFMLLSVIGTVSFIFVGVTSQRYPDTTRIMGTTLIPLAVGVALSLLIHSLTKRIKHKAVAVIVSLLLAAAMFFVVLLTGFGFVVLYEKY